MSNLLPPCAGIIVFNGDQTILVQTKAMRHSFPKGKRNKGESSIEAAWRELQEETGLTKENVQLISDTEFIDETSRKEHPSVRYYVGRLIKNLSKFTFDPTELQMVTWYNITDAMKLDKFDDKRKAILALAYGKIKSLNSLEISPLII